MLPTPKAWPTQNFRLPYDITVVFTRLHLSYSSSASSYSTTVPWFLPLSGAVFTWTANDSLTGHLITFCCLLEAHPTSDWPAPCHIPFTIARGSWKASHPVSLQQPAALLLPGLVDGHLAGVRDDRGQLEAFLV